MKAGLYIVATPIGNLGDITVRALEVLKAADVIVCEDSRVTGKLLSHYNINTSMVLYNDHSSDNERKKILKWVQDGRVVALVSDAGTPLISDPGYKLVRAMQETGLYVTTIPGASSVTAALTIAGMPTDRFFFQGFLPAKKQARTATLKKVAEINATLVIFERGSRVPATLKEMQQFFDRREIAIVREITKLYEEARRDNLSDLIAFYKTNPAPKGEVVIVVHPPIKQETTQEEINRLLLEALKTQSVKSASTKISRQLNLPRKQIYSRALRLREDE